MVFCKEEASGKIQVDGRVCASISICVHLQFLIHDRINRMDRIPEIVAKGRLFPLLTIDIKALPKP